MQPRNTKKSLFGNKAKQTETHRHLKGTARAWDWLDDRVIEARGLDEGIGIGMEGLCSSLCRLRDGRPKWVTAEAEAEVLATSLQLCLLALVNAIGEEYAEEEEFIETEWQVMDSIAGKVAEGRAQAKDTDAKERKEYLGPMGQRGLGEECFDGTQDWQATGSLDTDTGEEARWRQDECPDSARSRPTTVVEEALECRRS